MQRSRTVTVEKSSGGGSETKSEFRVFNEGAIRHNASVVEYCRTWTAVISGMGAGILGLTGLPGFAFYFVAVFGLWLLLIAKAGTHYDRYFTSRKQLLTSGFFGGLFTYILCWVFAYGMVHVY